MTGGRRSVAYLTGEYPRATDTFIQREIAAVEECGLAVERFAVRRTDDAHMVGDQQRAERDRTTYLLERPKGEYLRALFRRASLSPARFLSTARLAWRTRRLGPDGSFRQLAYFAEAAVLAELMVERGVDHLHNHFADSSCTVAMLAASFGGTTYSFTLHGPAIFFEPYEWHLGTKLETAAFCAAISSFARSQASLFCDPSVWDRIRIVHCGVAEPEPVAVGLDAVEGSSGTCDLLFVGRLDQVKGVLVLFEAVAELVAAGVAVRLTLVGDGPQRAELETRTHELELGDAVRFMGYRSQAEVQAHLAESDVFVLPSFAEGVPVSLMEAMARSVPVVATNVGGVTELVHDGVNGLVVAPGDVGAFRESIARLAGDSELRSAYGDAGHTTVRADFDSMTEARRLVTLFLDPAAASRATLRPEPHPQRR